MRDCSNAEIRDLLPELVNGRLSGERLAQVRAHLVECDLCQAEVALLERAKAVLVVGTPSIDTAGIVRALPVPGIRPRQRSFDWRIAAAITVFMAGGGGVAVVYNGWSTHPPADSVVAVAPASAVAGRADGSELSVSGDLSGLTDEQLRALLGKIEVIEALPAAEARVAAPLSGDVPVDNTGARGQSGAM